MGILSKIPTPGALLHAAFKHATFLPDSWYVRHEFKRTLGKRLNIKNPQSFNDKITWIKLYERNPLMKVFADKYAVKQHVAKILGNDYVIPLYGAWDSFDEIDFDTLPNQFVLKATNAGACTGVVICTDKETFDRDAARIRLNKALKEDLYILGREWAYKGMHKRIIAEKFVQDSHGDLKDYKLFCCNGEPKFMSIDYNRSSDHRSIYLDMNWNRLPYDDPGLKAPEDHIEQKPEGFDRMLEIARMFAKDFTFLRVDFYNADGHIYVGELTCYPGGGCHRFDPPSADLDCGDYLQLPKKGV